MTYIKTKIAVAGLVLAGALAYLGYAGIQKGWVYTLGVDQYMTQAADHGKRVRLCGTVSDDTLDIRKAQLSARFLLKGEHEKIPVAYKGSIPDMFKAGSEVVVEGKQDSTGTFQADVLMTKCASKYEDMPKNHPSVQGEKSQATPLTKGGPS